MIFPVFLARKEANINIQPKEIKTDKLTKVKIEQLKRTSISKLPIHAKKLALNPLKHWH